MDAAFEWLELMNQTARTIELEGWRIEDNYEDDEIPKLQLPAGGFAVVATGTGFYDNFPSFSGDIVFIADGTIGNGLSNSGDRLYLVDSTGKVIDAVSYGNDEVVFSPSCRDVAEGHSLERQPAGFDTDQASDFVDNGTPTPGSGLASPTPTLPPTKAPTTTATPAPTLPDTSAKENIVTPTATPTVTPTSGASLTATLTPRPTDLFGSVLNVTPTVSPTPTSTETPSANQTPAIPEGSASPWLYLVILIMILTWMVAQTLYFRHRTQG